jgi:hypothetical protein
MNEDDDNLLMYLRENYYPLGERGLRAIAEDGCPAGMLLVHNHIRHGVRTRSGWNGFRVWLAHPDPKYIECDCGWRPELGQHFRRAAG